MSGKTIGQSAASPRPLVRLFEPLISNFYITELEEEQSLVNDATGAASINSTHAFSRVSRSPPTLGAAAALT